MGEKTGAEFWAIIGVGVAALAFLWSLHNDVADLRERMARLEGLMEGFVTRQSAPDLQSQMQNPVINEATRELATFEMASGATKQ